MSKGLTPVQRLALTRASLAAALRDLLWLILLEKLLDAKTKTKAKAREQTDFNLFRFRHSA